MSPVWKAAFAAPLVLVAAQGSDEPREEVSPNKYTWLEDWKLSNATAERVPVPDGYRRTEAAAGTFADWLRHLPLKEGRPPVQLYDGREKANQDAHFAVIDIDVGDRDLQQCADAVMRLRAEYLYAKGDHETIHFNFTSGDRADFAEWAKGYRPTVTEDSVEWRQTAGEDRSYASFRKYLVIVFAYAGSASLSRELEPVEDVADMQIGDVFIKGGFPGHAVIVVDMAVDADSARKVFLLAQSYMPAQDIHILRNPANPDSNPWYPLDFGDQLITPEWTFSAGELRRFRAEAEENRSE
ncbi:MAG: DUF4846 domain-containing protein [Verrucomicrobia bacterium]|nr:DUF4846 domain-containing protein [Verrucomicrobiota bacterium]